MTPPSELPIIPEAPMQTAVDASKVATMNEEVQGDELLPCPFCGETTRLVANAYGIERAEETPEDRSHEVVCDGCGASGPERPPRSEAIAAWNRRASQQERGLEVSDEAVDAACRVVWPSFGKLGIEIETRRIMRAALLAASSVSPATGFEVKADTPTVVIGYTNWRGEYAEREIVPMHPWFGSTDWHPEPQWLLKAWDVSKDAERDFAVKDIGIRSSISPSVAKESGAAPQPSSTDSAWQDMTTAPFTFDKNGDRWLRPSLLGKWQSWGFESWVGQLDAGDIWLGREGQGSCFQSETPTHWQPLHTPPKATP